MEKNATLKLTEQYDTIRCEGDWTLDGIEQLEQEKFSFRGLSFFDKKTQTSKPTASAVTIEGDAIQAMDTAGALLLFRSQKTLEKAGQSVILQGFKAHHTDLLQIVANNSHPQIAQPKPPFFLERLGRETCQRLNQITDFLAFVGETFIVLLHSIISPSHIRWKTLFAHLHSDGVTALPIVGLLTFLTGIVLTFQGGSQLSTYGANIFIVDLVGITMLREMAPLLTAIIVAGRSGSAYTAQIGTMHLTEEIDALRTLGIAPMELLVLPKLLALMILMPLLCAYADIVGIFGSMIIASLSFNVSMGDYLARFPESVSLTNYLIGIGKAPVFAAAIVLVGCYQGFQVKEGGADVVGKQVTISVVQSIFLVIVVDALFSVLFSLLGIGLI
jgi:phospholipid/cholesterol/gamma-HCH transport system permease protein